MIYAVNRDDGDQFHALNFLLASMIYQQYYSYHSAIKIRSLQKPKRSLIMNLSVQFKTWEDTNSKNLVEHRLNGQLFGSLRIFYGGANQLTISSYNIPDNLAGIRIFKASWIAAIRLECC